MRDNFEAVTGADEEFPFGAMDFYAELTLDNSREFWEANKGRYLTLVRAPMQQIMDALSPEFGEAKLYRPNRDVRFRADKSPYKTHQGGRVTTAPACGFYDELNADDCFAGGGFYYAESDALAAFRKAVADDRLGPELVRLVDELEAAGWGVTGEQLKTSPRGYSADHPRIRFLRHKSLYLVHEVPPVTGIEAVTDEVAALWRDVAPLVDWLSAALEG